MLADTDPARAELLGAIGYTVNPTLLHTDALGAARAARAAGVVELRACPSCDADPTAVQVSYNMNRLQRLDTDRDLRGHPQRRAAQVDPDR